MGLMKMVFCRASFITKQIVHCSLFEKKLFNNDSKVDGMIWHSQRSEQYGCPNYVSFHHPFLNGLLIL